jgi:1-acyl-sn-glycerol-3-phosphate acyltransferase
MHRVLCIIIRTGTNILCRIDHDVLKRIPLQGPLIIASNHIGSLEVPLLYAHLQPRRMFGLAKVETWNNKFMGWLFSIFEAIPVRRGELDLIAFRRSLDVLSSGHILAVAPEGTRSRTGKLLIGNPGIVSIALHSNALIYPMVHWGSEVFGDNLKRLKRTDFHINIGKPFVFSTRGEKISGDLRQKMVTELMFQLAALLPSEYRGEYSDMSKKTEKYIEFL